MITAERPRATHRPCFLGTVPAKEPLAVSATDAPFPAEHEEQATRTGERLHLCWIPETSSERYVNGSSAAYCPGTPPQACANLLLTQRKLSISVQLSNPRDYTGGEFRMHDIEEQPPRDTIRQRGTLIILPSLVRHEVTPVKTGTRFSLVGWYRGERWQ